MAASFRHSLSKLSLIGVVVLASALGGCGRKGMLDLPPNATGQPAAVVETDGAAPSSAAVAAQSNVFDPTPGGNRLTVAPRGQKKRIILDPLLD